ncbi:unnamed protein product [Amaranthus hypochondriacus]
MTDDKDMIERFNQKSKMLVDATGVKYEYTRGDSSKTADIAGYEHTTSEFTFSKKESELVMDDTSSMWKKELRIHVIKWRRRTLNHKSIQEREIVGVTKEGL